MDRISRAGKVAVLVGNGHGNCWSTHWRAANAGVNREEMIFCPRVVKAVLGESDETVYEAVMATFPIVQADYAISLTVEWVPEGQQFVIDEDESLERLRLKSKVNWITA
jgi:hypothetical protein